MKRLSQTHYYKDRAVKRILLGIGLLLAIVAVAWQFAPADVEIEVETNGL